MQDSPYLNLIHQMKKESRTQFSLQRKLEPYVRHADEVEDVKSEYALLLLDEYVESMLKETAIKIIIEQLYYPNFDYLTSTNKLLSKYNEIKIDQS